MKKIFFLLYFFFFIVLGQEIVVNTDIRTISTVGLIDAALSVRVVEQSQMLISLTNIAKYHEEYYRTLYQNVQGNIPLRKRIAATDDKLKMLAKYVVLISLTVFLSQQLAGSSAGGFYHFLTRERLTWMLNVLMPQLLSRIILFKSYQSQTLNTLDLSYLIAGQHDILRSTKYLNVSIDKTLYMIIFIALLKIMVGTTPEENVTTIYQLGQTEAPAAGIYIDNLITNQLADDQLDDTN